MRRVRLVTGGGRCVEIGEDDPDRLHAAQAAIGMLGVVTEVELEVVPAYRLRERVEHWSWDEAWGRSKSSREMHRHYSFFWMPSDDSAALYGLAGAGESLAGRCHVKIYDEVDESMPDSDEPRRRVGPAHVDLSDGVRAELPRARVLRPVRARP